MDQKTIFMQSEGDAWFARNRLALGQRRLPDDDPVLRAMLALPPTPGGSPAKVLEIGCGDGTRLAWLQTHMGAQCHGVDPSAQAVAAARARGVQAVQGTADALAWDGASFDIVIFGFCLYLCDRDDLFRIASEADRVLRDPGWMLILDFFSPVPRSRPYHHRQGILSHKMDYRALFTWHPHYLCVTHEVRDHATGTHTDAQDEWVAMSVLRKCRGESQP